SEDIVKVVRMWFSQLKPDLVIYGVCLNDFLPSHKRQADYNNLNAYPFPLAPRLQKFLTDRTRLARLIEDAYDTSLRRIGLRTDFIDDILRDFGGKQERFGRDMKTLNGFVTAQGGPLVVGMVLDNLPEYNGRLYKIAKVAERLMTEAGMEVVPTES